MLDEPPADPARLRAGPDREELSGPRRSWWDAGLHVARAGTRRGAPDRRPDRHLQPGRGPLRDALRPPAVPLRERQRAAPPGPRGRAPAPPAGRPAIPRELERICLKAMAKRIADRYTTAGDLAEELRRAIRPAAPRARSGSRDPARSRRPGRVEGDLRGDLEGRPRPPPAPALPDLRRCRSPPGSGGPNCERLRRLEVLEDRRPATSPRWSGSSTRPSAARSRSSTAAASSRTSRPRSRRSTPRTSTSSWSVTASAAGR